MTPSYKERYKLDQKHLGHGGFAEVFRAWDLLTNTYVALKRLKKTKISSQDALSRMRREIEVQIDLVGKEINNDIPIMPIYDYDRYYTWYTMPIAENVLYNSPRPVPEEFLYKILLDCANGLRIAHRRHYIHRDLTPSNILYLLDSNCWIVSDWGLVRRYGYTTTIRTEQGMGTEGFAAPELFFNAHEVDGRADIYSLGKVTEWCIGKERKFIENPWRDFIDLTTHNERNKRPNDMEEVIAILENMRLTGKMQAKKFFKLRDIKPNRLKPNILKINGEEVRVQHWSEVLRHSLNNLGRMRDDFYKVLALRNIGARENCFANDQEILVLPYKIVGTNIYVEQKLASQEIINILDAVLSLFTIPEDYILVMIKE